MKNLLCGILILMSFSCASNKKITALSLDKSTCLGNCDSYSMHFKKEQNAIFLIFIPAGKTTLIKLSTKVKKELNHELKLLSGEQFNVFYGRKGELDLQKIKLHFNSNTIEINRSQHIPKKLTPLLTYLDKLIKKN